MPSAVDPPRQRSRLRAASGALAATCCLTLACASPDDTATSAPADGPAYEFLAGADTTAWVTIHDPARSAGGYTLALHRLRTPMLLDPAGRVVHAWPEVRVRSRARLLPDCTLLALSTGRTVVEHAWDGTLLREIQVDGHLPHHDVIRLENGNTLLLTRERGSATDDLLEVDADGEVVWRWQAKEHLAEWFDRGRPGRGDLDHINSVQELPANPWSEGGDGRFRPGNLLLSARNLNTIFVIDRETGAVTWSWAEELDLQHEALMIQPGMPGHGRILLFDNGYRGTYTDRQSEVLEVHPPTGEITWRFAESGFYSRTAGAQQPLPNGNVLVASSRGGRAFEVTREGRTVWQWAPPFEVMRPRRYPPDHCPELAALPRRAPRPVWPAIGYRHVDREAYQFARRGAIEEARVDGRRRRLLRQREICGRVLLPTGAVVHLGFGFAAPGEGEAVGSSEAVFGLDVQSPGEGEARRFEERLAADGEAWWTATVSLADLAHRDAVLCTRVEGAVGGPAPERAVWAAPVIRAGEGGEPERAGPLDELDPEEREAQLEHLRALGYVE